MPYNALSRFDRASYQSPADEVACKVCNARARLFGVLDLSRECNPVSHPRGVAGVPVYYHKCSECGLLFTCAFDEATSADWARYVYNEEYYRDVDADYEEIRPRQSFELMAGICRKMLSYEPVSGLDYGGGNGRLSQLLQQRGVDYLTYDPYGKSDPAATPARKANLISVFEVLEHTVDPAATFADMLRFAADRVVIVASTQVSDGRLDAGILDWDYIAPRSGHVSIYTRRSLERLARCHSLEYLPVTRGLHIMSRGIPTAKMKASALFVRLRQLLQAKLRAA